MEINNGRQAVRVQTSLLNAIEKRLLIFLAERQPAWVTSDLLTLTGFIGSLIIGAGYALTSVNANFLWLASMGFMINWYGDSLDGTLARVRHTQRPVYGFYIDHTLDCVNELVMFVGMGLSPLMDMRVAMFILVAYLLMTINVTINTYLKSEFRLTYAKLGPTELRLLAIILNTVMVLSPALRSFSTHLSIFSFEFTVTLLDLAGTVLFVLIMLMYGVTVIKDAAAYSAADPKRR